jgi:hypothetical protein
MPREFITDRLCQECENPFHPDSRRDAGRYCSRACYFAARRRAGGERFWARVPRGEGCWIWPGARQPNGYGRVAFWGRAVFAHRLAYELTYGPIPPGMQVCHRCDNRACVRPEHLFLGTQRENEDDKVAKGRQWSTLTPTDVREIRRLYAAGDLSQQAIANRFGVWQATISVIVRRKVWRHLA